MDAWKQQFGYKEIIRSLLLIKIGQDLGTDNELTQTIYNVITVMNTFITGAL
jgi:hypothetical protein